MTSTCTLAEFFKQSPVGQEPVQQSVAKKEAQSFELRRFPKKKKEKAQ